MQEAALEVKRQRDAALGAGQNLSAETTLQVVGVTAPVEEQQALLACVVIVDQGLAQNRRENLVRAASSRVLAEINDFHGRQLTRLYALRKLDHRVAVGAAMGIAFE